MDAAGIEQLDFVYVCGDAYVDHPSFGHAIISRLLEAHGYKVGIIAQPDWRDAASVQILGEPRLGFLVSAAIWTLGKSIRYQKNAVPRMRSHQAASWENDRIMPQLSTAI